MKSNLLKSIFCGLILTTILGSGVYAETVSYNRYGYNDDDIYEVIGGDAGRYLVDGTSTTLSITATSKSTSSKLYKVRVEQRYYRDNTLWDMHADSAVLKKGDDNSVVAGLPRDSRDVLSDYVTNAIAYNSSSEIKGVQDDCTLTIHQRDND